MLHGKLTISLAALSANRYVSDTNLSTFFSLLRQRKGEFVPDKTYPSPPNNKHNGDAGGEDLENIDTFIDPSTQITDVPHKPTRGSAGGSAGGPKKQRKPMGVKVTYKPPEWD